MEIKKSIDGFLLLKVYIYNMLDNINNKTGINFMAIKQKNQKIEVDNKSKTFENKKYSLPSDNEILKNFIEKNRVKLSEQAITSIEFAIKNDLPFVEVYQFDNSDFVITVSEKDYLLNVNHLYDFFLKTEKFEFCNKALKLKQLIRNNPRINEKEIDLV